MIHRRIRPMQGVALLNGLSDAEAARVCASQAARWLTHHLDNASLGGHSAYVFWSQLAHEYREAIRNSEAIVFESVTPTDIRAERISHKGAE